VHTDKAKFVELLHGSFDCTSLEIAARLGPDGYHQVHSIVAEDTKARVSDDFASWDYVREVCRKEVEYGLRNPSAVDVDTVKHDIDIAKLWVLGDIGLYRPFSKNISSPMYHLQQWACGQRIPDPIPHHEPNYPWNQLLGSQKYSS